MNAKLTIGMGVALALAACAGAPQPNAALENAHAAVQAAEADPNVPKYAPLDLETAKKELAMADDAAAHHHEDAIGQPAYLATQNARLAQAHGAAKADDARVAAGQVERDRIMLAARTREADNAKAAATNAQLEANAAVTQRDQATQEAQRLQGELEDLKAKQTTRGLVLTLGDVLFDTNKATLNPGAGRKLDELAQFLNEHPDHRVQIDGFTDSTGSDAYNEDLSQRRADAVKQALVMRGITPSRIGTEGYGKAYPVASNNESGGRQLNRRVEVVIGKDNGNIAPRSGE
ncbi:MAG TPA: OmpA family protein [Steroidobacteraceae bacterium]|jgi:outer membrane protein OmpA-like peptidoglycan-associated protein|nr:OmpA family protein [Steroidobacteraceae bacterium]